MVDGQIYVTCRDQIVILRDSNGDGETDFYENFNSDHQVTEHFHEFAMGLQTDAAGNFYYTKAARHGLPAVVPHHGTLLRVSRDGRRTDILATGFRAPNGVCVNPDGTFFVTDQEGFWLPKNRINWVKPGSFHGNMWGYHDVTDTSDAAMEPPVCWITNSFDRSPGEIVRVEGNGWGPLEGSLLNLSYGYGKIFIVLHETGGRKDARRNGDAADPAVPDRNHAGAIPSERRPALHVRHVRLGRQPDPARRFLSGAIHRQAGRGAGRPGGATRRDGDHIHRGLDRLDGYRPAELFGAGLGAETNCELRFRAHRRAVAARSFGEAFARRANGRARDSEPGADVVHGDHLCDQGRRGHGSRRRDTQHDPPVGRSRGRLPRKTRVHARQ